MARYRKVDVRIWNDEEFVAFTDSGKLAFLFLLTHPNLTSLGAMRATRAGLAEELRWPVAKFNRAFNAITSAGMAQHDQRSAFLWLPNFLRYNPPENGNVVKGWVKALDLLPECAMRGDMLTAARRHCETSTTKGVPEAFEETFGKPSPIQSPPPSGKPSRNGMPNQEQEQEPEPEQYPEDPRTPPTSEVEPLRAVTGARVVAFDVGESPARRRHLHCAYESAIGLDVPVKLHDEFAGRLRNAGIENPDETLQAWYRHVEPQWRGRMVAEDCFDFWRARWRETHGRQDGSKSARVAGLSGGGIPVPTVPPWRCHHVDQPCGQNAHCYLRTVREVRAGQVRLADVPEPLHSEVRDALAQDAGRTA